MKKLITILAMLMMVLSIHASDPVVLFGLLSPAASYSGSMESESIDADFLNHDTITGLIATAELERKDITIEKLLSDKIFTSSKALIDAGMIGLSLEDAGAIGTDGTVIITPDMSSMSSLEVKRRESFGTSSITASFSFFFKIWMLFHAALPNSSAVPSHNSFRASADVKRWGSATVVSNILKVNTASTP